MNQLELIHTFSETAIFYISFQRINKIINVMDVHRSQSRGDGSISSKVWNITSFLGGIIFDYIMYTLYNRVYITNFFMVDCGSGYERTMCYWIRTVTMEAINYAKIRWIGSIWRRRTDQIPNNKASRRAYLHSLARIECLHYTLERRGTTAY